jgi:CubicO group peptidase (beta-lactamase class C family)
MDGLKLVPPSWAPYTTPGYSNLGYQLLAYALENITGRPFEDMLENDIIKPLGLNHTFYSMPPSGSPGIVPNGNNWGWAFSLGEASPYVFNSSRRLHWITRGHVFQSVM